MLRNLAQNRGPLSLSFIIYLDFELPHLDIEQPLLDIELEISLSPRIAEED